MNENERALDILPVVKHRFFPFLQRYIYIYIYHPLEYCSKCRPYETEFVTETRPTGQVKKGDVSYVETGATTERIVSEAQPKPPSEK